MNKVKIDATIILAGILFSIIPISFVSINAESIETEGTFASSTDGLILNMFSPQQYHKDFVKTNWNGGDTVASMRIQALLNYEDQKKILIISEYSQLDAAIKTALDNNIQYLAYNNEGMNGDLSAPSEEVEQAAYYIELIADKTHAAGLDFISAPSFRIMIDVVNDVNWSNVDAEQILFQLQRSKSTQQIIDQFNEKASIIRPQAPNSTFVVQLNPEWQSIEDIKLVLESTNGEIGGIGIVCNTDACTEDFLDQLLTMRTQYSFETDPGLPLFCDDMTIDELLTSGLYTNIIDNRNGPSSTLTGTSGPDLIIAGDFGDTLVGKPGNDCLIGGAGDDVIKGAKNADQIFGQGGNDLLTGHKGWDFISGGEGDDIILGKNGVDILAGDAGNDVLNGGYGTDTCISDIEDTTSPVSCES